MTIFFIMITSIFQTFYKNPLSLFLEPLHLHPRVCNESKKKFSKKC